MKIARITLLLPLLVLGTIFAPNVIHLTHAAITPGEVCLADPTSAASSFPTPCPSSPPIFDGPRGQQLRVGVFVQGSYNVTGFDVDLVTNHTFLIPVGVDLTGTVVPGQTTVILECVQDIVKAGNAACSPYDSLDTLHFTVAGGVGQHTNPGTTGLLFTAIFAVSGTTATGGTPLGYQNGTRVPSGSPGCVGSSVSGLVCVTIAGGSNVADPETVQTATFDNSNSATLSYVSESSSSPFIGPEFPGSLGTATITATAQNGYSGAGCAPFCPYADNVTFRTVAGSGLTASLSSPSFCATGGTSCSITLTASAASAGNYTVTVYGTYATADPSGNPDTLTANVSLVIVVDDFGFAVNPATISFASGSSGLATVTLSSQNGFAGSISLSSGTISPTSPVLTINFSPNPSTLSQGQTIISTATFSSLASTLTTYHAQIKATSGSRVKTSPTLTVQADSVNPTTSSVVCAPVSISQGSSSSCTATTTDTNPSPITPTGTVSFTTSGTGNFSPSSCNLSAGSQTGASTCSATYSPTTGGSQTITGSYGGDTSHSGSSGQFPLTVTPPPDFAIVPTTPVIILSGMNGSSTIFVDSLFGFTGTVNLAIAVTPSTGLQCSLSPLVVSFPSGTVDTAMSTTLVCLGVAAGQYTVTVTGTSGSITHAVTVDFTVNVTGNSDFSIVANPTTVTTSQDATGSSTLTITGFSAFNGTVSLTESVNPSLGITCSVIPSQIARSGTASLSCVGGPGSYAITVAAASGTLIHSVLVMFNVTPQGTTAGRVCIANANATSCPVSAAIITGPSASSNTQIRVAILVDSSQTLSGFDVTLVTNSSILVPWGVSLIGSVLTSTSEIVKCIGGTNKIGSTPCNTRDTSNTIQYSVVGTLTNQPITGLLFTAIYNVTGNSASSSIVFQTGCTSTSVTGGVCITIANGSTSFVQETSQNAKFSNLAYFELTPSIRTIQLAQGDTNNTGFVTVTSLNSFGGSGGATVTFATSVSGGNSSSPIFTVSPSSVTVAVGKDGLAGLTITVPQNTAPGNYVLNLTGTAAGLPSNSITIVLNVPAPNFSVTVSPPIISLDATQSSNSIITVASIANFGGNVTLSLASPTGITATFPAQQASLVLELARRGTNTTTFTVSSTIAGVYSLSITARSGSLVQVVAVQILVKDFRLAGIHGPVPDSMQIVNGTSSIEMLVVAATSDAYNGTITIGPVTVAPLSGISVSCQPTVLKIVSFITTIGFNETDCTVQAFVVGSYTVTVSASSSTGSSHSISFPVSVLPVLPPPQPAFNIFKSTASVTVQAGQNATVTITLNSVSGFAGTVSLTSTTSPVLSSGPVLTFSSNTVTLSSGTTASSILKIATTKTTPTTVTYSVFISGNSGNLTVNSPLTIIVQPAADIPPVAIFSFTPTNPGTGQQVFFNGSGSFDPDGTVVTWMWNPGDGFVGIITNSPFFSHTYTSPGNYTVTLTVQDNAALNGVSSMIVNVHQAPPDKPPVAKFTFTPTSPIVGQQVVFDGTGSFDPDGVVTSWTWNPGDGSGPVFTGGFFYHTYTSPGNYTVTLTVTDNGGLTGSVSQIIAVRPQPAHDVSIVYVNAYPQLVVATQQVGINFQVRNDGFSNETVSITANANGRPVATEGGIFLQGCKIVLFGGYCNNYFYGFLTWNTTGTIPGNYTISATVFLPSGEVDPTPTDNTAVDGTITVFPAPVLAVNPNSGSVGTKVTVSGANFAPPIPNSNSFGPVWVTFDDMFLGEQFGVNNGTFTFIFDVPQAQPGTHLVKAFNLYTGARASTTFTVVQSSNGILAVTINTGSIYFPGDKAVAYILTTLNGVPTGPANVQLTVTLYFSNGTSKPMSTASLGPGLYEAVYPVPTTVPLGTYTIVARAHMAGPLDATSLATFEVKLNWLSSNKNTIITATTLAGVIGLVGVAWKKGYLRSKKNEDSQPEF